MTPTDKFSRREEEIFDTLKALQGCEFTLIGGYAVNTYTLPRFSTDCDIVVADAAMFEKIAVILHQRGYNETQGKADSDYSSEYKRLEKEIEKDLSVSVDILIGAVSDRQTSAKFSAEWITQHSSRQSLRGKTIRKAVTVRIIERDALLVAKITSCRDTDIRDAFMMLPDANDIAWIISEIAQRCDAKSRVRKLLESVEKPQFRDGLAGVYGSIDPKTFTKHLQAVRTLHANT